MLLRHFQNGQKPVFTQNANINKMGKQQRPIFVYFHLFFINQTFLRNFNFLAGFGNIFDGLSYLDPFCH
jgi:hypothetical protein